MEGKYTNAFIASKAFLKTYEWRKVRLEVLIRYESRCMCCGATPQSGVVICVDHIKPIKTHPELALDINNLQVLCDVCNHGKANWIVHDWRSDGTFVVCEDWINANRTPAGSFTTMQLNALGYNWKSIKSGWIKNLSGLVITLEQKKQFEDGAFLSQRELRRLKKEALKDCRQAKKKKK